MDFTGERFIPTLDLGDEIYAEHYHRYMSIQGLVKDKVVLDAACGEGYGTNILAQYAKRVVGIDISQESIEWASNNYTKENVEFKKSSIENLPFPDNTFDIVVSFETIEHVNEQIQHSFLMEIGRVLRENGILIMSTPNKAVTVQQEGSNHFHIKEFYKEEFIEYLNSKFSHIEIYNQNYGKFSIIERNLESNGMIALTNDKGLRLKDNYFIAIASNQPQKIEFRNSLFEVKEIEKAKANILQIFYKLNNNYTERNSISIRIDKGIKRIKKQIDFKIDDVVKEIRIDPLDHSAIIRINEIILIDKDKNQLDVTNEIISNAIKIDKKDYIFITEDPQWIIKVQNNYVLSSIEIDYEILEDYLDINETFKELIKQQSNKKEISTERSIYIDSGNGFNEEEKIIFEKNIEEIDITHLNAKNIRIDISNKPIYAQINKLNIILNDNQEIKYDINSLKNNADIQINNQYIFFNNDSQILVSGLENKLISKIHLEYVVIEEDFEIQAYHNLIKNILAENEKKVQYLINDKENILEIQENITNHNVKIIEMYNKLLEKKEELLKENSVIQQECIEGKELISELKSEIENYKQKISYLNEEITKHIQNEEELLLKQNLMETKLNNLENTLFKIKNSRRWKLLNKLKKWDI